MSESRDALFDEFARLHVTRIQQLLRKQETHLIEAARERWGRLTLEEIQTVCRQASDDKRELSLVLSGLVREFELWRGRRADSESRQNLLGRLMIQSFEHLCEGHYPGGIRQGALNRRMIPAFLRAAAFLIGSQHCEAGQKKLMKLYEVKVAEVGMNHAPTVWPDFYAHQEAKWVSIGLSARFLSRFFPYDKRRDWFMTYMSDHLGEIEETLPMAGSGDAWHFQNNHYLAVMKAFTADLRGLLRSAKGRHRLGLMVSKERLSKLKAAASQLEAELQAQSCMAD